MPERSKFTKKEKETGIVLIKDRSQCPDIDCCDHDDIQLNVHPKPCKVPLKYFKKIS